MMTTAIIYNGTIAITLINQFFENYKNRFKPRYYAMDSAYDFESIYKKIIKEHKDVKKS